MSYKLELSVFRFDAKSDYLPFYKKHYIKIEKNRTVEDLLFLIKEDDILFDYPKDNNAAININNRNLFTKVKIDDIVRDFGYKLTLMPLSQKRAKKDLIIDDKDFYEKFDLIDPFVDSSDKKRFKELIIYHYASDIYNYTDEFQGDALFLFAYDMLEKYPSQSEHILKIIAKKENGIFLHVPICGKTYPKDFSIEKKINNLKHQIVSKRPYLNDFIAEVTKETV